MKAVLCLYPKSTTPMWSSFSITEKRYFKALNLKVLFKVKVISSTRTEVIEMNLFTELKLPNGSAIPNRIAKAAM